MIATKAGDKQQSVVSGVQICTTVKKDWIGLSKY